MTEAVPTPQFLEPAVDTDIPLPPELAEAIAAHPDAHDFAAPAPERDEEAVAAVPTAAPPRPVAPPQEPMAAGTFAIYDDGQGGVVLVIGTREGETHHKRIPAKLIKAGEMMMGGNSPLAALFGRL